MSPDFMNDPVVWVPWWLAVSAGLAGAFVVAQRRCVPEWLDSLQHARSRVAQTFLVLFWVVISAHGPGNLLPAFWSDLLGVLATPVAAVLIVLAWRVSKRFDELEKREHSIFDSEGLTP